METVRLAIPPIMRAAIKTIHFVMIWATESSATAAVIARIAMIQLYPSARTEPVAPVIPFRTWAVHQQCRIARMVRKALSVLGAEEIMIARGQGLASV